MERELQKISEAYERSLASREIRECIGRIFDFFRDSGAKIDPVPDVKIDFGDNSPSDPLIRTGCYDGDVRRITLFCGNRHLKDILRTFCHELVHHSQNLLNPETFKRMNKEGNLCDNEELAKMESDAYAKGNVLFRKWTESIAR